MSGFVVVIIARPGSRAIDHEALSLIQSRISGNLTWLDAAEACEIVVAVRPANSLETDLRAALAPRPVDIAILPAEQRRKRLLIADMDSTMIDQECIDELASLAGVADRVAAITTAAMRGEVGFEESLLQRVALLRDIPASAIEQVIAERISLSAGGRQLVATMRRHGAYAALISGGFVEFTGAVARRLGFDEHRANRLVAQDGRLTGDVARPILGRAAKLEVLDELCATLGLTRADAIAVGDGANDIPMLEAAGLGVALHGKPAVRKAAAVRIDHADLTALLYLQGYRRTEFVSAASGDEGEA